MWHKILKIMKSIPNVMLYGTISMIFSFIYGFEYLFWLFGILLVSGLSASSFFMAISGETDKNSKKHCFLIGIIFAICLVVLIMIGISVKLI